MFGIGGRKERKERKEQKKGSRSQLKDGGIRTQIKTINNSISCII